MRSLGMSAGRRILRRESTTGARTIVKGRFDVRNQLIIEMDAI
jgi:hypothetical protein